jgi:hypothetical protein
LVGSAAENKLVGGFGRALRWRREKQQRRRARFQINRNLPAIQPHVP